MFFFTYLTDCLIEWILKTQDVRITTFYTVRSNQEPIEIAEPIKLRLLTKN